MNMWKKLRKEYTDYTLEDIGKKLGVTRQSISKYEKGLMPMPKKVQIMYLGFRNNYYDKIVIKYLKEMLGE